MSITITNPWETPVVQADPAPATRPVPAPPPGPANAPSAPLSGRADAEVKQATDGLVAALETFMQAVPAGPGVSFETAARTHQAVAAVIKQLGQAQNLLTRAAEQLPHEKVTVVEGLGVVEFTRSASYKFNDAEIIRSLTQQSAVNTFTGEITSTPNYEEVLKQVVSCSRRDWRIQDLRRVLGEGADTLRETTFGATRMKITG